MIGRTLAHYEITALLGKGGMGEVYRARDTKLGRDVAIKVLPADMSRDPERLARFDREARTLATLQHGNIASIYGFETTGNIRFLVMELVDGEDLSERLQRGPLLVDDAVDLALQLTEGLDAAHGVGIIHRDLKPANIKVSQDGKLKILDFGLARAYAADEGFASDPEHSPTITALTQAGVILGTAAYMSPEQARGKQVDQRADIWAFGVILFEMLTGRRLFSGEGVSDVLAAVIRAEPKWEQLPKDTPTSIRRLLRRCLAKNPRDRLQAIADARLELSEDPSEGPSTESVARSWWRPHPVWLLLIALGAALALGLGRVLAPEQSRPAEEAIYSSIQLPDGWQIAGWASPAVEYSPDGRTLAYVAQSGDFKRLFVQDLTEPSPREVPDSDGAEGPFFSPDGMHVAFGSGRISGQGSGPGRLRRYSIASGKVDIVCDLPDYFGGAWREDGTIFFAGVLPGSLWKVPAAGGIAEPLGGAEQLDSNQTPRGIVWPQILPGGRRALVTVWEGAFGGRAYIIDLDNGDLEPLNVDSCFSRWTRHGELITTYPDGRIFASGFDATRYQLQSNPREILSGVSMGANQVPVLSVAHSGNLVYSDGPLAGSGTDLSRLAWLGEDRSLSPLEAIQPDYFSSIAISPDGRKVAAGAGFADIWIFDLERGTRLKLPRGETLSQARVLWTPDGQGVVFSAASLASSAGYNLYLQPADGVQLPRQLEARHGEFHAYSFVPKTRRLLHAGYVSARDLESGLFEIDLDGGDPTAILDEEGSLAGPAISPDGRWLAYVSLGVEGAEIFLRSYPDLSRKFPLGEGSWPHWSPDGKKLYFGRGHQRYSNSIWVRDVDLSGNEPVFDRPRELLATEQTLRSWCVDPLGRGILLLQGIEGAGVIDHFRLVQGWSQSNDVRGIGAPDSR